MATILVPIPHAGFDPTEMAVPWKSLRALGHVVVFATPDGAPGTADERMLTGRGLGVFARLLMADSNGRRAYAELELSEGFRTRCFCRFRLPGRTGPHSHEASCLVKFRYSAALQELEYRIIKNWVSRAVLRITFRHEYDHSLPRTSQEHAVRV